MAGTTPHLKRSRLSLDGSLEPETESVGATGLIEYFSQRGGRLREVEAENASLAGKVEALQKDLLRVRSQLDSTQDDARRKAEASQSTIGTCRKDQEAAEDACRREMARTASSVARLKQAETRQYEALDQAERAESRVVELEGRLEQERLSAGLASAKLRAQLQAAEEQASALTKRGSARQDTAGQQGPEQELKRLRQRLEEEATAAAREATRRCKLEVALAEATQRLELAESRAREAEKCADGSNADVIRSLRSELRAGAADVAQARRIQARAESLGVLQEKLAAAEARAAAADRRCADADALRAEVVALETRGEAWERGARELGLDGPGELPARLAEIREQQLEATARVSELEGEAGQAREEARAASRQHSEAEAALHNVQGLNAELSASAARSERRAALLMKERDGLQKMLASYRLEATQDMDKPGAPDPAATAECEMLRDKIGGLEAQVGELEAVVARAASAARLLQESLADATARAAAEEEQAHQARREAERLAMENSELQARVDRGEFNAAATRVLHYVINPEAEARKEAEAARVRELSDEVAVLRAQLQGAGGPDGRGPEGSAPAAANVALEAEVLVLQQKVAELTKREARLKDVFQKQATNFREAVYLLFGYRVDMAAEAAPPGAATPPPSSFVLRPQHAESSRMQLMFRLRGGAMELVPTEFTARRLKREVEMFIERFHSIPAFTANWTMELFQKQTQH